jgi:hypothetical protein
LWNDSFQEIYVGSGNPTVTYSDIEGGWEGECNIDADPLFVDPKNDDFHLQNMSPCIDRGTAQGTPPFDLEGDPRMDHPDMPNDPTIWDMGADEYRTEGSFNFFVFNSPQTVQIGTYGAYNVIISNYGHSPIDVTDVWAYIEGPYPTERHLRDEPFIIFPGQVEVRGPIKIWVPLETPLGEYTVDTVCFYNEEQLVNAEFSTEVVKERFGSRGSQWSSLRLDNDCCYYEFQR